MKQESLEIIPKMVITKEGYAVINTDTHISKWVIENKRLDFDNNAIPLILDFINEGDVVIDAGANIGAYAHAFLYKIDKSGTLLCFEPNHVAYECLKYNIRGENAMTFNMALSNISGKGDMIQNLNLGASIFIPDLKGKVEMRTIDSFNFPKVDFVKADCEGHELHILQGAIQTILRDKPKLYIEINEGTLAKFGVIPEQIFDFLHLYEYEYRNIYKEQKMEGPQFDIICW